MKVFHTTITRHPAARPIPTADHCRIIGVHGEAGDTVYVTTPHYGACGRIVSYDGEEATIRGRRGSGLRFPERALSWVAKEYVEMRSEGYAVLLREPVLVLF